MPSEPYTYHHAATPGLPGCTYLALDRAMEFIADEAQLRQMLGLLLEALERDMPLIEAELARGEVQAAQERLHAFKGYTPIFCCDALVEHVARVEGLSKTLQAEPTREAYARLAPQLMALRDEVAAYLAAGGLP